MCKKTCGRTLCSCFVGCEVLHSSKNTHQAVGDHCRKEKVDDPVPRSRARSESPNPNPNTTLKRSGDREVDEISNVYHVVTNASSDQIEGQLRIFEDNEAMIKMIKKRAEVPR